MLFFIYSLSDLTKPNNLKDQINELYRFLDYDIKDKSKEFGNKPKINIKKPLIYLFSNNIILINLIFNFRIINNN